MSYSKETIENIESILTENQLLVSKLSSAQIGSVIDAIRKAKRLFFMGTGRSGLALKMAAMRFMHLGFEVYIVGEIVTPSIMEGDVLLLASGSGSTSTVVIAAQKAKKAKATVVAFTTTNDSPLTQYADQILLIPAAQKTDFSENVSVQYAGSLFEQFTLIVLDGIFTSLWQHAGLTKEELWPRHANLE